MTMVSGRSMARMSLAAFSFTSCLLINALPARAASFQEFETGQVRPLTISEDKKYLYAVNTPDNRLEIFRITDNGLSHRGSVTVGLEPIAVSARCEDEVWVVNHLSDSVSVVDVSDPDHPRVERTLLVGDEPRDIVFAGPNHNRAFITTAHRGQNVPYDPQFTTPGVGRADVWVYDADNLGSSSLGGVPITILQLFSDTPRSLAVSPDGTRVYAAGFHSGNQTTTIHKYLVRDNGGLPGPRTDVHGNPQPLTGLIVKFDGQHWRDNKGHPWDDQIRLKLPDKDVFVINAMSNPPAQLSGSAGFYTGVGTILYNMAVNPANGKIYVSNTDANNVNRFEGPGVFAGETVRGHLMESRITVLSGSQVKPRHLNKHINYNSCCAPTPNPVSEKSLSTPTGMAVTADGQKLYVAALGSSKIGIFDTVALENNTFTPSTSNQIDIENNGEPVGPTGLALDEDRGRLYVATRFDNGITIVKTSTKQVVGRVPLYNPEPPSIVHGRRFLYDARRGSANGESSCASCHVFGDFDSLAWDLGNPDGTTQTNPGPFCRNIDFGIPAVPNFPALKGPMTTQSLRGMANHGPMHWRGDRTAGNDEATAQPDSGTFNEKAGFEKFQAGFIDLLGRSGPLADADMESFADFILQVMYPPNPIRNLDNSLTPDQQVGRDHFFKPDTDLGFSCSTCHKLDRDANAEFGVQFPGFFGTEGGSVRGIQPQDMKTPHFRNMYQKVGMFGMKEVPDEIYPGYNDFTGDQVRGFGFVHDGADDTIFRFHKAIGFDKLFSADGFDDSPGGNGDQERHQTEAFILAFDTNLFPVVGQQVTVTANNLAAASPRLDLFLSRANAGDCDVVAKVVVLGEEYGFLYVGNNQFASSRQSFGNVNKSVLLSLAQVLHQSVTFTAVPPGSGARIGIDRDEDGVRDGDE